MKNTLRLLTLVVALLTATIGLRNLVVSAAPVSAHQIVVLHNGSGDPPPPDCPPNQKCSVN